MSTRPEQRALLNEPGSASVETSKKRRDDCVSSRNLKRNRSKRKSFPNGFQDIYAHTKRPKTAGDDNYRNKPLSGQDLYQDVATQRLNQNSGGCSYAMAPESTEGSQPTEAYGYAPSRKFDDTPDGAVLPPSLLNQFAPDSQPRSPGRERYLDKATRNLQERCSPARFEGSQRRPLGTPSIPIVIELLDDTITPWDLDPNAIEEGIRATGGDGVLTIKTTASGGFVVHVCKSEAAIQLQLMTTLLGVEICAHLSSWYHENMAKMRDVPLHMTNKHVLKALAPYGVIGARRATAYTRLDDGSCIETPKGTIILNFAPQVDELPVSLLIEGNWYKVEPSVRRPLQCMNCYGYQHHARQCTSPARCKLCAGYHFHKECNSFTTYRCLNCNDAHAATYSLCPVRCMYMKAMAVIREMPEPLTGPSFTSAVF